MASGDERPAGVAVGDGQPAVALDGASPPRRGGDGNRRMHA